jgi:ubiquinone/menaquinone biosynthesis C-methylase UbiE
MMSRALILAAAALFSGAQSAAQLTQEMKQAEHDVPMMVDVLELKPGMTVADVGAGFGANTIVFAKWIGPSGRVFATDIGANQLKLIRGAVESEKLTNVTVVEGAPAATNLPAACCDAIFMRDVYHHIGDTAAFDKSLLGSLKPGGRLAVIDFLPRPGSKLPEGVTANRGGHGITPALVVSEVSASGLAHVRTLDRWPPDSADSDPFFLVLFRRP